MRTKGALNKPKFTYVKLSDLCQALQPDRPIPVKIEFAEELALINKVFPLESLIVQTNNLKPKEDKIEFSIS